MKAPPKGERAARATPRANGRARRTDDDATGGAITDAGAAAEDAEPQETQPPAPPTAASEPRTFWTALVASLRADWRLPAALVLLGLGVTFVLLGWYGAAHTNIPTEQMPYLISGGLLGLGLIIVAGVFAASAASDREMRVLRAQIAEALSQIPASGMSSREPAGSPSRVFVVRGGRSYHVAGCPIIEGKDGVREVTARAASADGLAACKLCAAD